MPTIDAYLFDCALSVLSIRPGQHDADGTVDRTKHIGNDMVLAVGAYVPTAETVRLPVR